MTTAARPGGTNMTEFFETLLAPEITFLRHAFAVSLLASIAFGMVGTYIVARRITYTAGAIAHCVLAGVGAACFCQSRFGWTWFDPMLGAVLSALAAALVIGIVSLYAQEREDTIIGAIWALGMAIGLLFFAKTPGYVDPMSILFGNILLISGRDLWLVAGLDLIVVTASLLFYNKLLAVSFDEEFARLQGIRTGLYHVLLLCLTALTVVLSVRVVGIVLVIALLTLPAAVAGHLVGRVGRMMGVAILCCAAFTTAGITISYPTGLPSGPTIIIVAAAAYFLVLTAKHFRAHR